VNYSEKSDLLSMLKMLRRGRADVVLDYELDIKPLLKEAGLGDDYVFINSVIVNNIHFCFAKKNKELKNYFDEKFKILFQSGKIRELMIKNIGSDNRLPKIDF